MTGSEGGGGEERVQKTPEGDGRRSLKRRVCQKNYANDGRVKNMNEHKLCGVPSQAGVVPLGSEPEPPPPVQYGRGNTMPPKRAPHH